MEDLRTEHERLRWSSDGFAETFPAYSARRPYSLGQLVGFGVLIASLIVGFVLARRWVGIGLMTFFLVLYTWVVLFRVNLILRGVRGRSSRVVISDADAVAVPESELPTVTVLVPAYREAEVLGEIVAGLSRLHYPASLLDVKLLLESDDDETVAALADIDLPAHINAVIVPVASPRTKPKALNYGLLTARGEIVTVYDAEDHPDPLQLRRAALAFQRSGPDVACFQAELAYFNADENLLTRWFAIEYRMWFTQFLPGLAAVQAPIPLGGTSNHFRRDVLVPLGGWDSYNVTEDADLGLRLCRQGWKVGLISSVTYEEANTDVVNWVKQRSRWYKGYLQTWLVHMRHPLKLMRELGLRSFLRFNLFVGGTPMLALMNPVFWLMLTLWFLIEPTFIREIMPAPVYYTGLICWLLGNSSLYFLTCVTAWEFDRSRIFRAALVVPLYWVLMSLAAAKAALQMVVNPSYWEKTQHGLSSRTRSSVATNGAGHGQEPGQ